MAFEGRGIVGLAGNPTLFIASDLANSKCLHSRWHYGHVIFQCLALSDSSCSPAWWYYIGSWYHCFGVGCPCREDNGNIWDGGLGWSWRDIADKSWFFARFDIFSNNDRPNYMPCGLRYAVWGSRRTDYHVDCVKQQWWCWPRKPQGRDNVGIYRDNTFHWLCILLMWKQV